jgi:hypothetical protein
LVAYLSHRHKTFLRPSWIWKHFLRRTCIWAGTECATESSNHARVRFHIDKKCGPESDIRRWMMCGFREARKVDAAMPCVHISERAHWIQGTAWNDLTFYDTKPRCRCVENINKYQERGKGSKWLSIHYQLTCRRLYLCTRLPCVFSPLVLFAARSPRPFSACALSVRVCNRLWQI